MATKTSGATGKSSSAKAPSKPNAPSTTGNKSGGGRSNNPPASPPAKKSR